MELPFEAAKGAAEKVLMVRFPVLMRVMLPGLLATAVLYPTVGWLLGRLPTAPEAAWQKIAAYAVLAFILGALISSLNNQTYELYEGRSFWPDGLFTWATDRQQAVVDKMRRAAEATRGNTIRYNEIWYKLRNYPMDETGQREARYPTALGNILAGYEQYPLNRYGMDSIFYWPRIWLQMEKDRKEEIDSQWSVADGLLTMSAISMVGGILWLVEALGDSLNLTSFPIPLDSAGLAALAGIGWLLLGYGWYRLSLPFHRENGEVFKSIFDLYRSKIQDMTALQPREKEHWKAAWAYLQYLRLKCPNCGRYNTLTSPQCSTCGFGLAEFAKSFRDSGKFPE